MEAVGPGVDESWTGRRVVLNAAVPVTPTPNPEVTPAPARLRMIGEHVAGTNAEYFVAPETNVLDVGDADPVNAASFALSHLTAWRMLVDPVVVVLLDDRAGVRRLEQKLELAAYLLRVSFELLSRLGDQLLALLR